TPLPDALPICGQARGVQQLAAGGMDEVRLLAVVHLDPLVVAGHRHHGARAREAGTEHAIGAGRLEAGIDGPRTLVLGPCRLEAPARELERALQLAVVIDVLTDDGGLCARRDAEHRLPVECLRRLRGVGPQESLSIDLEHLPSAHELPPLASWARSYSPSTAVLFAGAAMRVHATQRTGTEVESPQVEVSLEPCVGALFVQGQVLVHDGIEVGVEGIVGPPGGGVLSGARVVGSMTSCYGE